MRVICFPLLGLIGAAVSAIGAIASAKAQADQARYNAQVEEINARTAAQKGQAEADKKEDEGQRLMGQQRAQAAKAGLNVALGSPAMVINQEGTSNSWLDQQTILWNGETEQTAHLNKATQYRQEAKSAEQAGAFGAASSFLGGLGKAVASSNSSSSTFID